MNGTTPAQIEEWVKNAWQDVTLEFARCWGDIPDEEILDEVRSIFAGTIENAIRNHGVEWEEPIRSYALRHVCKIAKRADRCGTCGKGSTKGDIQEVAEGVFDEAHKTCQRLEKMKITTAEKIGIICNRA